MHLNMRAIVALLLVTLDSASTYTFAATKLKPQHGCLLGSVKLKPRHGHYLLPAPVGRRGAFATQMSETGIDWGQTIKYPVATLLQFGLIAAFFKAIDALVILPAPLVAVLIAFLSLRSRLFSALSANRPPRGGFDVDGKRVPTPPETIRPWWTPPGIAFPFIWLTITALRAASSSIVFTATGRVLCSPPLLLLAFHLSVGDTWNCITNVEQRKGVSAVGVLVVWLSVVAAVKAYYTAAPLAGYLLAPSACWITIASVLTWTIWKINPPLEPLLPMKGNGHASPLVLPLVFRPKDAWEVITKPPAGGPPKKKED